MNMRKVRIWWREHATGLMAMGLVVVMAAGLWQNYQRIEEVRELRGAIVQDSLRQLEYRLADSLRAQRIYAVAHAREEARRAAARQKSLDDLRAQFIRASDIRACKRENQIRMRLRHFAVTQLDIAERQTRATTMPDRSLFEFVEKMTALETALKQLRNDMAPIDCDKLP